MKITEEYIWDNCISDFWIIAEINRQQIFFLTQHFVSAVYVFFKTVSGNKKRLYFITATFHLFCSPLVRHFKEMSSITFRADYISAISWQEAKKYCLFASALIYRFFHRYPAVNTNFDKSDWTCATDGSSKKIFLTISRRNGAWHRGERSVAKSHSFRAFSGQR